MSPSSMTMTPTAPPDRSSRRHHVPPAALVLGLTLLLAVLATAFALPAVNSGPHEVPIGVAAPEAVAGKIETAMAQKQPGAFDVTAYAGADEARTAIENREIYGALVVDATGATMLTAPAASPAVAQILTAMAAGLQDALQLPAAVPVEQVVPLPSGDPLGSGFGVFLMPMVLGSLLTGVAVSVLVASRWTRLGTVLGVAVVAGLTLAAIGGPWLGIFTGGFWATAGLIALGIGAGALTVIGLHSLLGFAGIGLGALIIFVVGNPLSGAASAPELLPTGWSTLGQYLPPGALGTALRSVSYFDGAAAGTSLLVLAAWVLAGALLLGLGGMVRGKAQLAR